MITAAVMIQIKIFGNSWGNPETFSRWSGVECGDIFAEKAVNFSPKEWSRKFFSFQSDKEDTENGRIPISILGYYMSHNHFRQSLRFHLWKVEELFAICH